MSDIIDINIYPVVEQISLTIEPNLTTINVNTISGGGGAVDSVNGQTGVVVLDIPTNTSDLINDGEDGIHPYITLLDLPSNLILYPTTVASDVVGYVKLVTDIHDPNYNVTAVDVSTGVITTTNQLISSLITVPDLISGNPGVFNISTVGNIRRSAGSGTAEFYFNVYKRDSLGTETLIGVSNPTLPVNNGVYAEFSATAIWDDGVFTATDRIVLKFYGSRIAGGSNPTYEFQFGGLTPVRTLVPIPLSVVPSIPNATETVAGIAEIATTAEVSTGTDDTRIITPLKLKAVTNLKANKTDITDCVVLASPISTTSLTAIDTNLKHAILANEELFFVCMLSATTASGGIKYQVTAPTGAVVTGLFMSTSSTSFTFRGTQLIANTLTLAVQTSSFIYGAILQFSVKNSTTAGDVIVSFASGTGGTTTIEAGSSLVKNKTRPV